MGVETQVKVTIPLAEAVRILKEADAVIADLEGGATVLFPGLEDLTGNPENEFLHLSCESEGESYSATFAEENNATVEVEDGDTLLFEDTEGCEVAITPLFHRALL